MERCLLYVRRTWNNIIRRPRRNESPSPIHQRSTNDEVTCSDIVYQCAKTGLIMIVILYMLLVIGMVSEVLTNKGKSRAGIYIFIGTITVVFVVVSVCLIWLLWANSKKRTGNGSVRSEHPEPVISYDAYQRVVHWLNNIETEN